MLKWITVFLALAHAGWMTFDGTRALITGDYVTAKSGKYAGQLGPWTYLAEAVGIAPRSTLMKSIFLVSGLAWLVGIAGFALGARWGWWAMVIGSVATAWNLIFGTVMNAIVLVLLVVLRR